MTFISINQAQNGGKKVNFESDSHVSETDYESDEDDVGSYMEWFVFVIYYLDNIFKVKLVQKIISKR